MTGSARTARAIQYCQNLSNIVNHHKKGKSGVAPHKKLKDDIAKQPKTADFYSSLLPCARWCCALTYRFFYKSMVLRY